VTAEVELHTFSIAARCSRTGSFGVAVATARPAAGSIVPWVSEHGAIATQARTNTELGRKGLSLIGHGVSVGVALPALLACDPDRATRQVHGVDASGVFAYTGEACVPWCGHHTADGVSAAGNMLAGAGVLEAMLAAFVASAESELAARLLAALAAGQAAGGDQRGKQSAALVVAAIDPRPYHNLRVDDHPDPVAELLRLHDVMLPFVDVLRQDYGAEGVRRYRQVKR